MKILGVDICHDRAVCWLLESVPCDVKAYWKRESKHRSKDPMKDEFTFYFTKAGIKGLLALQPDAIALEPTGMHYSWLVAHIVARENVRVLWIGHTQAVSYRRQNNLPDKNDLADAMALACYALIYFGKNSYFINFDAGMLALMRELFLQQKSLARFQNPLINRAKQQLAREFPEASNVVTNRGRDGRRALWCWLAGRERNLKHQRHYWQRKYSESVASHYGVEISDFTRWLAKMIDDVDLQHLVNEKQMFDLVYDRQFEQYNLVFDAFNFNLSLRCLLLSQIYPISRFESMGAFKKRIGAAKDENSSGNINLLLKGGSKLCRSEFYLWITTTIANPKLRPQSAVGQSICSKYDDWVTQFNSNTQLRQQHLAKKTQATAIESMRRIVENNLKPYIDGKQLQTQLVLMETMFCASWNTNVKVEPLNKSQARRKFGKLIIGKTTGYTARWLYRLLKKNCENYEQ